MAIVWWFVPLADIVQGYRVVADVWRRTALTAAQVGTALVVIWWVLWLAALGLVVPVLVFEEIPLGGALPRAWRLARADYLHAVGFLLTLGIVVVLSQSVLVFTLRGFGDAAGSVALFLASVVLSPILFVGAALLYVDQTARVE